MRVLFFAPFKPITSNIPSGDREIARGLHAYLSANGEVKILSNYHSLFFWRSIQGILFYPVYFVAALVKVLSWSPDYFFTYHVYHKAPDPFAFIFAKIFGRPHFIFEGMYSDKPRKHFKSWIGWWFTKQSLSSASHVFTDKKDDISGLQKVLPLERITYIPPSIDLEFFKKNTHATIEIIAEQKRKNRVVILGVAMLRPDRKSEGVEFLLRCLIDLQNEGLDFFYIHIGDGERFDSLKKLAEENMPGRNFFAGRLDKEEIRNYLSCADFFAFPGIDEAFGLVYVEAQACGLPVVAFYNGGVPEAVANKRSGFLTELLNQEEMKKSLRDLIQNEELRLKMGREARKFVEESFNREVNYKKMLEIIKKNKSSP